MTNQAKTLIETIVQTHLNSLLAADVEKWVNMWDEEGVFEFPFAPDGYTKVLNGKAEMADYMAGFPEKIQIDSFEIKEIFQNESGEEGVLEFTCKGKILATGLAYNQHYVAILKTKSGKLSLYRDFWDPIVAIKSFGGQDAFKHAFAVEEK
ncbi:MAG: nuclear transport factor 2 family protein [Paraglaciecola sp.]|nr:nuclear transport factor 2 family protein [Paraglaciecola sp.]